MELVNPADASANAARVLEKFRNDGELVIHIRHNFEPGGDIHNSVSPMEGEKVTTKDHANAFRDTDLLEYLHKNEIEKLVLTGMQTHMCVEATTRAAADLEFECIVVSDACTTRDLSFEDNKIAWQDVHYATLSTLQGSYATILNTADFMLKY